MNGYGHYIPKHPKRTLWLESAPLNPVKPQSPNLRRPLLQTAVLRGGAAHVGMELLEDVDEGGGWAEGGGTEKESPMAWPGP